MVQSRKNVYNEIDLHYFLGQSKKILFMKFQRLFYVIFFSSLQTNRLKCKYCDLEVVISGMLFLCLKK